MRYKNPIIRGFNPDPSVCRADSGYYLVTSTFEYFPGIPIYHSTDLINWTHTANAVTRAEQLPLAKAEASGGIWAPTIRFNNGMFYITATFSGIGNFIIYTDDPRGEWSDAVWTDMDGIDPSMLFDGGKMYYCANDCGSRACLHKTEGISLAEMDPMTGKVNGAVRRIWDGTGGGWLEAPHIYHIDGMYYLLAAEGGTGVNHTSVLARSRNVWGPYEECPFNPILTSRNDTTKQVSCAGHADMVEGPDGSMYMVHLASRPYVNGGTTLGRETFLTPVKHVNGWFAAEHKKALIDNISDINTGQRIQHVFCCRFETEGWEPQWLFPRGRSDKYIERGNGALILRPSAAKLTDDMGLPSLAAVRQPDFECEAEIELDFSPLEDGCEAGLAVYLSPRNIYKIAKRRENGTDYIVTDKLADDFEQEIYRVKAPEGVLKFTVKSNTEKYEFFWSANDSGAAAAGSASAKFMTTDAAEHCFTGTLIGVWAQSVTESKSRAVIYRYSVKSNPDGI